MSTTLTIRNLEEAVKQKLRILAATHGRSMEAEAREILKQGVFQGNKIDSQGIGPSTKGKFNSLIGVWKNRLSTDEVMKITRGE